MTTPYFQSDKYYPQVFVAKALIENEGKFLLLKEPQTSSWKPGKWGLPGGKVDPGEDIFTALKREVREELDNEVTVQSIISVEEIIYFHPKLQQKQLTHHVVFLCQLKEKIQKENAQWYIPSELLQLDVDDLTEFYLPKLFQQISTQNFHTFHENTDLFHIWNVLDDEKYENWYRK